jgi:hypothetical protein
MALLLSQWPALANRHLPGGPAPGPLDSPRLARPLAGPGRAVGAACPRPAGALRAIDRKEAPGNELLGRPARRQVDGLRPWRSAHFAGLAARWAAPRHLAGPGPGWQTTLAGQLTGGAARRPARVVWRGRPAPRTPRLRPGQVGGGGGHLWARPATTPPRQPAKRLGRALALLPYRPTLGQSRVPRQPAKWRPSAARHEPARLPAPALRARGSHRPVARPLPYWRTDPHRYAKKRSA